MTGGAGAKTHPVRVSFVPSCAEGELSAPVSGMLFLYRLVKQLLHKTS